LADPLGSSRKSIASILRFRIVKAAIASSSPAALPLTGGARASACAVDGCRDQERGRPASPSFGSPPLESATETGLPVWLGVSVEVAVDGQIAMLDRPQEGLDELLDALLGSTVSAVTVMHSVIEAVPSGLDLIARHWSGPVGRIRTAATTNARVILGDITPEAFEGASASWIDRGAQLVGGCYGIRPEHIRALADNRSDRPPEDAGRAPAA
jgi:hypothetical protein